MEINCTKRAHIIINIHEEYGSWNNIIYVLGREHKSVRLFFSFFFFTSVKFPLFSGVCSINKADSAE